MGRGSEKGQKSVTYFLNGSLTKLDTYVSYKWLKIHKSYILRIFQCELAIPANYYSSVTSFTIIVNILKFLQKNGFS